MAWWDFNQQQDLPQTILGICSIRKHSTWDGPGVHFRDGGAAGETSGPDRRHGIQHEVTSSLAGTVMDQAGAVIPDTEFSTK